MQRQIKLLSGKTVLKTDGCFLYFDMLFCRFKLLDFLSFLREREKFCNDFMRIQEQAVGHTNNVCFCLSCLIFIRGVTVD